jgi:glycosyltransferase involved in cell wall biosynthesis
LFSVYAITLAIYLVCAIYENQSAIMNKEKIHICFDARMYLHSGIGVYILQQIESLKKDSEITLSIIAPEKNIPEFEGLQQIIWTTKIYSIIEQLFYPYIIPTCDIFWSPHYNIPLLPIRAKKRWVTIHDVYHLKFAHTLSLAQKLYARICFATACRLSEKIITVSRFSANEIQSFFDVQHKIEVRLNKVDTNKFSKHYTKEFTTSILNKYSIDFPYILFVGNIKPHKNLITLLIAFNKIKEQITPTKLLIVGKKEGFITEDNEIKRYIERNHELTKYLHFTGLVEHNELPVLYQQAKLFIFPSLYEGFGYPPLEALAAGTKVLCSNAGPMPEVCGDKVDYFDPIDADALSVLICDTLSSC